MIDLSTLADAMKKVVEAIVEVFQQLAEVVKKLWNAIKPLVIKVALSKAGLKIINKRGRNKLVPIYGRML